VTNVETPAAEGEGPAKPARMLGETTDSLRAVLRNPNLRRVQLAFLGSSIGDWAYATAIVVWAYGVGGAKAVGIWMGIRFVLGALTAPVGATFADRWPRRRVMILTDLARAVLIAGAAVLIALDTGTAVVFVLVTLASLLASPFMIAQRALLPSLAQSPGELTAANGVHSTIESLAFFAGPALAAGLLAFTSVPVVLAANVVTFAWSLALVTRLTVDAANQKPVAGTGPNDDGDAEPADGETGGDEPSPGFVEETLAGFKAIRNDRALLLATVGVSLQTIVAGASVVFLVVMAAEVLALGPEGLGYLEAVLGVGAVVGGVLAIARSSRGTLGRDLTTGVVLWSAPLLLVTAWPSPVACFLAVALLGLANPLVDVNMDTIFQRVTPDAMLGRVFGALESCVIATMALGAFAMPFIIDWVGLRYALAVIAVPVAGFALAQLPAMLRLDARLTAPRGLDLLRAVDIFAPLDPATLESLARSLDEVHVPAGTVILREGAESDLFYVIESGQVQVTQGERTLRTEGPGDYFGEIGLLRDVPRTATITAVADTVVHTLARRDFLRAVTGHRESRTAAEGVVRRRLAV
jgi:MFS family permease